jgi:multiple sugar transport system permease protein
MLIPAMGLLLALNTYPVVMAIWNGFHDINTLSREGVWVGLQQYWELMQMPLFWQSLRRSFFWTVPGVLIQLVLGLVLSIVLSRNLRGQWLARGLVLFPYLVPAIVTALVWRAMFNADTGFINYLLVDLLHVLDQPVAWFSDPSLAMPAVIAVGVWKYTPFMVILFLARLQTTPLELYEAARMDGARPWQEFRYVTLPWLAPTIYVAVLLRTMFLFNDFDMVYLLTFGGPRYATTTLPVLIRTVAFDFQKLGLASAISVMMLMVLVALSIFYLRFYARSEERLTQ